MRIKMILDSLSKEKLELIEGIVGKVVESLERRGNKEKPFAVLDFDNCFIWHDLGEATMHYVLRNNLLRDEHLLESGNYRGDYWKQALRETKGIQDYHQRFFYVFRKLLEKNTNDVSIAARMLGQSFSGYSSDEVKDLVQRALEVEGQELGTQEIFGISGIWKGIRLAPESIELRRRLLDEGVECYFLTASPTSVVKPFVEEYIGKDRVIGVETEKDSKGFYTNRVIEPAPIKSGKTGAIVRLISSDVSPVLGISDSGSDLPMLEMSDVKVATYLGKENRLIKKCRDAQSRGDLSWYIL